MNHPHDPLIRAWLDGRAVQYMDGDRWVDIEPAATIVKCPHFYRDCAYRLKPLTIRVRNAVMIDGGKAWVVACNTLEEERMTASHPNFARWAGDWQDLIA